MKKERKGIILAGGKGSRLYPTTVGVCKQLLPIFDKPMIYYPLSTLMLTGIRDILIISNERDLENFKLLLGNGENFGINLNYIIQPNPGGIAEAFLLGEHFLNKKPCSLILGDNLFYGQNLTNQLRKANQSNISTLFAYQVNDPERYGVVEFDEKFKVIDIEEKPINPRSSYAVTGLYFYDENVSELAKEILPSKRGELEITDLNNLYLKEGNLKVELFGRGTAWLDTGTFDSLLEAGNFIRTLEHRQGLKIGCPEEIAFQNGWITKEKLIKIALNLNSSEYGKYLLKITI